MGDLVTRAFILTLNQVSGGLCISNRAAAHPTWADTQICVCACGKKMTHMGLTGLHMYDKWWQAIYRNPELNEVLVKSRDSTTLWWPCSTFESCLLALSCFRSESSCTFVWACLRFCSVASCCAAPLSAWSALTCCWRDRSRCRKTQEVCFLLLLDICRGAPEGREEYTHLKLQSVSLKIAVDTWELKRKLTIYTSKECLLQKI